jgi:ATP-dependent Clp protease ATP-binding subunit ClpB
MAVNINRLTEKSQEALFAAQQMAEQMNHSQVEPEHLLAALLQQGEGVVPQVLARVGANPQAVLAQVEDELNRLPQITGATAQVSISSCLRQVLVRAHDEIQQLRDEYVSTEHLLLAGEFMEGDTVAVDVNPNGEEFVFRSQG